ncbi:uncharacterized protein LOC112191806 [Rosa chinensis]|uniref:uncharacterized protein LOC112191806 n=1 Tax=Rosa chinensis TaxID=74649 RepID=UPI000D095419|nr:uncharacterized protein LOC112191806 [Rosa chinensis]
MRVHLMLISELDVNPAQLKMLRTKLKHLLFGRRFVKYDASSQKLLDKHGIRWKGEVPNAPDNGHRGRGCGRSATGEALTDRPPLPKGHGYLSLGTWADAHGNASKIYSSCSALMYCRVCGMEGDHWRRNCPNRHRPEPEPTPAVPINKKKNQNQFSRHRERKNQIPLQAPTTAHMRPKNDESCRSL